LVEILRGIYNKDQNLNDAEIMKEASNRLFNEYMKRVYKKILSNAYINSLSPNLGKTLVDHAKAILIMRDAVKSVNELVAEHVDGYRKKLVKANPIKSKSSAWLEEQIARIKVLDITILSRQTEFN
jgi:hypothetical protein